MKHKSKLCVHVGIQQWVVNYWEFYVPVVNWISVSSLLAIASIRELIGISTYSVLYFTRSDIYVDLFM